MEFECDEHFRCTLKCALDIGCQDFEVYIALLRKNPATIEDISELVGKDKSTVYKSIQKLLEKGLVERDYRILRGGGYRYLYKPIPFSEFKVIIMRALETWGKKVLNSIATIEKMDPKKLEETLKSVR
ncbi:MAG: ArsR family transcriptional regulator [Archaeoglobaceae archaeon]|nr:ArsR family transcriptional regulator [Archaeoglobaceae archaeon]